jgi:hypothetical protein
MGKLLAVCAAGIETLGAAGVVGAAELNKGAGGGLESAVLLAVLGLLLNPSFSQNEDWELVAPVVEQPVNANTVEAMIALVAMERRIGRSPLEWRVADHPFQNAPGTVSARVIETCGR